MLKTPNRPRAPSAATLRVLYQLAYISSGTAVGIGALCAEERRRRTQIVQKVADNAKRLRQSPRYAHGAAAAAVREQEQDFENDFAWGGVRVETDELRHDVAARRRAKMVEDHEGGKNAQLPSVVEDEYVRLAQGSRKKSRRRDLNGRPDFVVEHGHRDASTEAEAKAEQRSRGIQQARTSSSIRPKITPSGLETGKEYAAAVHSKNKSLEWISYQRSIRYGVERGELRPMARKTKPFQATKEGQMHQSSKDNFETTKMSFDTHHLWTETQGSQQSVSPETLARDVEVFFEKVNDDAVPRMSRPDACRIADGLLDLSLETGLSSSMIRSLILWKLAAKTLSAKDLFNAARSFGKIAQNLSPEVTIQFFSDLLATSVYREASREERTRIILALQSEALKLDVLDEDKAMFERLPRAVKSPKKLDPAVFAKPLQQECMQLVVEGHLSSAVKLWCMTLRARSHKRSHDEEEVENKLFDAAIDGRHLSLCVQLLRFKDFAFYGDNSRQKDAFIRVCFNEGAVGMLQKLFGTSSGLKYNTTLSQESYGYLCRCFATVLKKKPTFKLYYDRLSPEMRASVEEAGVTSRALALKADWKARRDIGHTRWRCELAVEHYEHVLGLDVKELHIAMIEIELSAKRPLAALKVLYMLNQKGLDGEIVTLTALALAKQNDWLAFGELFETLKRYRTIWFWTPTMKRAYNNALHLFSRSHSAQQVSDFVLMSVDELRFLPNQSTWEVLMSSLVSKRAIGHLKYWIRFRVSPEGKSHMNAGIAAALIKTWYLDCRASHMLVMFFCRDMVHAAPSLHSDALLNIVRETIGYDLRNLHGCNAPWMEPLIRARQALLETSNGRIPHPGLRRDRMLWVKQTAVTADQILSGHVVSQRSTPLVRGDLSSQSTTQAAESTIATDTAPAARLDVTHDANHDIGAEEAHNLAHATTTRATSSDTLGFAEDFGSTHIQTLSMKVSPDAATQPGAETIASVRTPTRYLATFEDLRASYQTGIFNDQDQGAAAEVPAAEILERQMILHLSLREYDTVLELYHKSLDGVGLPASPMSLEVAAEASLRNNNDRHEAEGIISAARDAGMNVACAMGPLIIDQIRRTVLDDARSTATLRSSVMEYYRSNERNGLHVKHHVATKAAHALIQAGHARSGVNLLNTILQSPWVAEKPLDITAMTVWLAGYVALNHEEGMRWVIDEVLRSGMNIDQAFMRGLKRARYPAVLTGGEPTYYSKQQPRTRALLRQWYAECAERRKAQMHESRIFGRKLVGVLIKAVNGDYFAAKQRRRAFRRMKRRRQETVVQGGPRSKKSRAKRKGSGS